MKSISIPFYWGILLFTLSILGAALLCDLHVRAAKSAQGDSGNSGQPKANDHRIVEVQPGVYQIEYYRDWPGWIPFGTPHLHDLEGAQKMIQILDYEPKVVE